MMVKYNYNNKNNIEIIFVNVTINKSITFPMKQIPNVVALNKMLFIIDTQKNDAKFYGKN
jgi:hypothetical protein